VTAADDWARLRRAIAGEPLPTALIDLDALDANVARLLAPARGAGKRVRIASKSIRVPAVMKHVAAQSDGVVNGVMAYAAGECPMLVEQGWRDVLVAYPTVQPSDLACVVDANLAGGSVSLIVDSEAHVNAIARAAAARGACVPLVIDVDMSFRPRRGVHLGVRRSPLREPAEVVALASRIADRKELRFEGIMGYEAQIAGVADLDFARRAMKALSRRGS
jgi:D-serine deaminase-like pyridoxal phosphate-dependent protein